jgi:hypothetical protein
MAAGIETKTAAGSITTLATGYLSGLLIEVVPWLKDNLTADQKQNLPIILAWIFASAAAYFAPHTHRPDLASVPASEPLPVTGVMADEITEAPPEEDPSQHVSGRAGAAPDA